MKISAPAMGTIVSIEVVDAEDARARASVERALGWFSAVERGCSRFDPASELSTLLGCVGTPTAVTPMLFELLRFAVAVAEETGGAYDPAVGGLMEARGFNRDYRSGEPVNRVRPPGEAATYRDITLDANAHTVTLRRPLVLDLGGVAKGCAIDLARQELAGFRSFAIDAGGDLYLGGAPHGGAGWSVGIRHPRRDGDLIDVVTVSNAAVCTSGDYERRSADGGHHLIDPLRGTTAAAVASATVIAASAMLADALATAAFVLGPEPGLALLESHGAEGLIVSPDLDCRSTRGFPSEHHRRRRDRAPLDGGAALLSHA
jgi:thiamine biosynthesis lipoprotein